jgi:hypothetical protein
MLSETAKKMFEKVKNKRVHSKTRIFRQRCRPPYETHPTWRAKSRRSFQGCCKQHNYFWMLREYRTSTRRTDSQLEDARTDARAKPASNRANRRNQRRKAWTPIDRNNHLEVPFFALFLRIHLSFAPRYTFPAKTEKKIK